MQMRSKLTIFVQMAPEQKTRKVVKVLWAVRFALNLSYAQTEHAQKTKESATSNIQRNKRKSGIFIRQIKCIDGKYRPDCSFIKYTACTQEQPFRCPDGRCVTLFIQCASHICPADRPYRCVGNTCVKNINECDYGWNLFLARNVVLDINDATKIYPLLPVIKTTFNCGYVRASRKVRLIVEGVGMSEVENSHIIPESFTEPIFERYLGIPAIQAKPIEFILSPIVRIKGLHQEEMKEPQGEIELKLNANVIGPIEDIGIIPVHVC